MSKKITQEQPLSDQISVPRDSVPLFVDLDGTLIKTDLLIESAFFFIKKTTVDVVGYALLVGIR